VSVWNTISGVTALRQILEIGMILGAGFCFGSIFLLRRSDRRVAEFRNDNVEVSSKRMRSIESAAEDIRKELLEVQQERDILVEKLNAKEDDYQKLQLALDDAVKRAAISASRSAEDNVQRVTKSEDSIKKAQALPAQGSSAQESPAEVSPTPEPESAPLSREQREQLIALLDPGPKGDVDILSIIGNDRSNILADELDSIFSADGWTTKGVAQSAFSNVPEGIVLSVHSKETAPSYASFIQRTMATIGFPVTAAVNNKYREWSLTLIVGKIP